MLYLLTLGWPWFAAAAALGLAVGFATSRRGPGFPDAWVFLLALSLVAVLGGGAFAGALPGREGLWLEIGCLASAAYAFGLPIGGFAKTSLAVPATVAKSRPKPVIAAATAPPEISPPPGATQAPPAPAQEVAPEHKRFPGRRPAALAEPRGAGPDDLLRIKGIGPKSVEKLHGLGVFHFDQIAAWDIENARWIGAALAVPGRVERGKWIQQARDILARRAEKAAS